MSQPLKNVAVIGAGTYSDGSFMMVLTFQFIGRCGWTDHSHQDPRKGRLQSHYHRGDIPRRSQDQQIHESLGRTPSSSVWLCLLLITYQGAHHVSHAAHDEKQMGKILHEQTQPSIKHIRSHRQRDFRCHVGPVCSRRGRGALLHACATDRLPPRRSRRMFELDARCMSNLAEHPFNCHAESGSSSRSLIPTPSSRAHSPARLSRPSTSTPRSTSRISWLDSSLAVAQLSEALYSMSPRSSKAALTSFAAAVQTCPQWTR